MSAPKDTICVNNRHGLTSILNKNNIIQIHQYLQNSRNHIRIPEKAIFNFKMSSEDELAKIARKLDKISNRKDSSSTAQALDLLKILQRMPITLDLIQKTRIGLIVNNLRKSINDEEVGTVSKSLIKRWKKLLDGKDSKSGTPSENGNGSNSMAIDESSQGSTTSKSNNGLSNNHFGENQSSPVSSSTGNGLTIPKPSSMPMVSSSSSNSGKQNVTSSNSQSSNSNSSITSQSGDQPRKPSLASASFVNPLRQSSFPMNTNDSVRLKCREMLASALKPDDAMIEEEGGDGGGFYDHIQLGALIEDAVFKEFKDTNMKYKNRIRSRVANLKDSKNPDLKLNVLRGAIKPEKIAIMTAEEMASKEMQLLRQKFTKEAINDAQMSLTGGTKTDLLKCPACKKNNCTYNQVQTRSADEPMTTFCYCNECGKRWKFC